MLSIVCKAIPISTNSEIPIPYFSFLFSFKHEPRVYAILLTTCKGVRTGTSSWHTSTW